MVYDIIIPELAWFYIVELNDIFLKRKMFCVFLFLTLNIFSTMFWTSLILRLELLPFEFPWGFFFLRFFLKLI